jgi:hypothetical protein
MLICSRTGRVLRPGQSMRVLTREGFTDGVYEGARLADGLRLRAGTHVHTVRLDEVEAVWRLHS